MLVGAARLLMLGDAIPEEIIRNALLESFTLHARALVHFFFPSNPWGDDVLAADFFPSPDVWERIRGRMAPVLAKVSPRVGKEVAHLTYARLDVTPEAKRWPVADIATALAAIADTFRVHANPDHLGDLWKPPAPE